ncbi:MAG: AAA family ATPase [Verrucomicrobia bacterium]|nr:AAA family ATPase [Verrucomicrobiota bacterium]
MPSREFDFSASGAAPGGWRLHRLEMANWGTFGEGLVHSLAPEGGWTLLVGENGSGKSTAVDALRTLLAPRVALQHSFNDAAGGQKKKDRTLTTYIRGAWATQRDEDDAQTEMKFLRKEEIPACVLAVFRNARSQAVLTLAQILWVANGKDETVYLVGGGERGIEELLKGLETGRGMKKEIERRGFDVRDSYKAYREDFCARMGIPGEGALEIFNQAIGVKEVSDVSVFLRRNLLTHGGAHEFIQKQVVPRFSDLESCWNDIGRAENQIALLAPVAAAHVEVSELEAKRGEVQKLQGALQHYYLQRHAELLREHLDRCALELGSAKAALAEIEVRQKHAKQNYGSALLALESDKTQERIRELELEMKEVKQRASEREGNHQEFAALLRAEELGPVPGDEAAFATMRGALVTRLGELKSWQDAANSRANEVGVKAKALEREVAAIKAELESLATRQALIPGYLQHIREALSDTTGVVVGELPFAGELMEVKPEYAEDWSGAIERLLYNFGVSLLVPERHYQRVARWVNGRRLTNAAGDGVRLLFHRVPQEGPRVVGQADTHTVPGRLNFRDEHPLARWVAGEVQASFHHACCGDTAELERERFGLTKDGLIRNGTRHVKDDRRALGLRRDYVLGWSPERKIQALKQQLNEDTKAFSDATAMEKTERREAGVFQQRTQKIEAADALPGFAAIDFSAEQARLAELAKQRRDLEKSSKKRETLQRQFDDAEAESKKLEGQRDDVVAKVREKTGQLDEFRPKLDATEDRLAREELRDFTDLAPAYIEVEDGVELTHLNLGEVRERVDKSLSRRTGGFTAKINEALLVMIAPMQKFLGEYPDEGKTLSAKPEYAAEFVALHDHLVREDLPKHKERFRTFLNTNLTECIGGLEAMLDAEVKTHRERIGQVNTALHGLDYGDGTFVELIRRDTRDAGIRDFKAQLRDSLGAGLNPDLGIDMTPPASTACAVRWY